MSEIPSKKFRVVFMGTAEIACPILEGLIAAPFVDLVTVVSQPDKPRGREMLLVPTAVKSLAARCGIPVLQPNRARDESFVTELRALAPDLIVVVAYGQILPPSILTIPPHGCVNVHTSLLPRHRGAAPIQWAILSGDHETGVTLMKMDEGLDTGDIIAMETTVISRADTSATVHDRLATIAARLLVDTLPKYLSGELRPCRQPLEGATYARKISRQDGLVSWDASAEELFLRVRAFTPWPGAFTYEQKSNGRMLKLLKVEPVTRTGTPGVVLESNGGELVVGCGRDALQILELQREGGKPLPAEEFLKGYRINVGEQLGPPPSRPGP